MIAYEAIMIMLGTLNHVSNKYRYQITSIYNKNNAKK